MKLASLGLVALLLSTASALALDPATETVVNGARIYTDPKGMTLYTFDKDAVGTSTCYGACAASWQPFAAAAGAVPDGDEWTLIARTDGTKVWAHHGKALYTYVEDKKPGDALGDGKNAEWHIAVPD